MYRDFLIGFIIAFVMVFVLSIVDFYSSDFRCTERWAESSMKSKYGVFSGCHVEHGGFWIPEKNYRKL